MSNPRARPQATAKAQAEYAPVSFLLHSYLGHSYSKMQSGLYNLNFLKEFLDPCELWGFASWSRQSTSQSHRALVIVTLLCSEIVFKLMASVPKQFHLCLHGYVSLQSFLLCFFIFLSIGVLLLFQTINCYFLLPVYGSHEFATSPKA